jgi:hypothetical protein
MPLHDIIDNRESILLDHVKSLLRDWVSAKFAVGYFFTSGLAPLMDDVQHLQELKILIGNSNHEKMTEWFDWLWNQSEEFDEDLMDELSKSCALNEVRPYDAPKINYSMAMLKTCREAEIVPRILPGLSGT